MKGNMTPKRLSDYCKSHTCQSNCRYNKLCWYVFRLDNPDIIYDEFKNNKSSLEFEKLNCLCKMINENIPNDLNEIKRMGYL